MEGSTCLRIDAGQASPAGLAPADRVRGDGDVCIVLPVCLQQLDVVLQHTVSGPRATNSRTHSLRDSPIPGSLRRGLILLLHVPQH